MQGDDDEEEDEDDDDEDARLDFSIPSSGAAKEYQLIVERCEALQQVCKTNNRIILDEIIACSILHDRTTSDLPGGSPKSRASCESRTACGSS